MDSKMSKSDRVAHFTALFKRWLIAIVDIVLITLANLLMCYFTQYGGVSDSEYSLVLYSYPHIFAISILVVAVNYVLGLYKSVWEYASIDEMIRCFVSSAINAALLIVIDRVAYRSWARLPFYSYVLYLLLVVFALTAPRLSIRVIKYIMPMIKSLGKHNAVPRIMIVGAGYMGNFVIDSLFVDGYKRGKPVIAVDDNPAKLHKRISGIRVVGSCDKIVDFAAKYNIDEIIICMPSASKARQKEIIDLAMQTKAKVKISPSVSDMFEEGGNRRVRSVNINDLLSRPEVKLDKKVCQYLIGKTILVTGGGGSIGSEICMQVARYNPKTIVIFDIYENCAFELANSLEDKYDSNIDVQVRIGSVRDMSRLKEIFTEFDIDVVFHAAAHKHVPIMESSPCEAVKNNVFGTYNVALVADEFKVSKMVIISTDKAVNPSNVMGCTKRITEIIAQYMNQKSETTSYSAVRFGNVLGSHGSVIPIFEQQIRHGGPVKVTHPDITRYFMTIPEAAQLVCQAGGLAKGGEVFVLDMGEPVRIMDLAKNLIRLSGFTEDEIGIEIVGLRPGEKLYEELALGEEMETRQKTANEKIFVNQPITIDDDEFERMIEALKNVNQDNVREVLKKIVPSYNIKNNVQNVC